MRAIAFNGEIYVAVKEVLKGTFTKEDYEELLSTKYPNNGRVISLKVCSKKTKKDIQERYKDLVLFWDKNELLDMLAVHYRVKKSIIKQWVRGVHNEGKNKEGT